MVAKLHYSGKWGAFIASECLGVASFGPPLDKSKVIGLVRNTQWSNFLELNRRALENACREIPKLAVSPLRGTDLRDASAH